MTSQNIILNLIPKGISPRLYVSQYDKGQEWNLDIYAGTEAYTIPSGSTVTIQGTKPDKTGFQYACSFSGNRVTATEQQQMTIIAGEVPAEIRIEKNNEIIATLNFIIAVEKAALADDTVISETDLPLIEEAIEVLGHADELVQRIEGDVTTSGNNALKAEGFAVGQQNGSDVASGSPYYHNNAKYYKEQAANSASTASNKASDASGSASAASGSASSASTNALKAEGFAVGQQNGSDVASGSPYYHNSAKYYKEQAADSASTASTKAGEAAASAQAAAQSAAHLTIDSAMSTSSENALQNKVISTTIQNLSNQVNHNAYGKGKNLIPNFKGNYDGGGTLTFTKNDDDSITVNGSNSSTVGYTYQDELSEEVLLPAGSYVLSGCPSGGSNDTYRLQVYKTNGTLVTIDTGSGATFTLSEPSKVWIAIRIQGGYTVSSKRFYSMICTAADWANSHDYEPYAKTNHELTTDVGGLIANTTQLGAVNMLPNNATSQVVNGITFTVNADKTVTASGTNDGNDVSRLFPTSYVNYYRDSVELPAGTYRLSGCPSGGRVGANYYYGMELTNREGNGSRIGWDFGDGLTFTLNTATKVSLCITVFNDYAISGSLLFKPMIALTSYTGEYTPYAKSNRELTELTKVSTKDYISTTYGIGLALTKVGRVITAQVIGDVIQAIAKNTTVYTLPEEARPYNYGMFVWITDQKTMDSSSDLSVQLLTKGYINTDGKVTTGAIANGAKARSQMVSYIAANDTPLS